MHLVCVIPARIGSTRLPHKPLRLLAGEPLIRVVARRVLDMHLPGPVVVATDDQRVADAVAPLGVPALLTSAHHESGTARVAEVIARPEYRDAEIVVNVQGDEPFMPDAAVRGAVEEVHGGADVGTAAQPLDDPAAGHAERVAVNVDHTGAARRFVRGPVPEGPWSAWYEHIGVYAYRPRRLFEWLALPPVVGESAVALEQLRPLHHGWRIGVTVLRDRLAHSIDTETDLQLAEAML